MKLNLSLIITVCLGTTLFAMDNANKDDNKRTFSERDSQEEEKQVYSEKKIKVDDSQIKKTLQYNSTNLLAITAGITISGVQNIIAQYATELRDIKELKETGYRGKISSIKFSPMFGKLMENKEVNYQVASAFTNDPSGNYIRVWDIIPGNCIKKIEAFSKCISYSHDGKFLACASFINNGHIAIYELESGDCCNKINTNNSSFIVRHEITSLSYSPNKKHIIIGDNNSNVRIITSCLTKTLQNFDPNMILITSVTCSPCANYIAAAGEKKIKIWEIKSRDCVQNLKGHKDNINEISYSPCGNFLASASNDNTLKIWDVKSGDCTQTLNGHTSRVTSVSYLTDNKQLVSGSCDGTIRLWDASSGNCIQVINYGDEILSIACSPCGNYIAAGNNKGIIQVLELLDRILLR